MSYASMSYASLSYASLSYASMSHASMSHASISYASMSYASMSYASLSYASMSYASIYTWPAYRRGTGAATCRALSRRCVAAGSMSVTATRPASTPRACSCRRSAASGPS
jgi:hypothetical protein